jgi:gamma-glutamyltranspeptidase/glutathione hydrolase
MGIRAVGQDRPGSGRRRLVPAAPALLAVLLALPGCTTVSNTFSAVGNAIAGPGSGPQAGQEGFVRGFLGHVAAEEPRAALAARNVLSAGGTAVDAAVAAGLMMGVTLPSRAGLGGGGACLVFNPRRGDAEAVLFPPGARQAVPAGADRPAAIPMTPRGLFLLHTRGGRRPFEELVAPAEQAARFGVEVSGALAADLAAVAGPLFADPWAAAIFGRSGQPYATGERLVQTDLATTLATLRTAGVGDMYQGGLARRLEETTVSAGGGLTVAELRASVPQTAQVQQQRLGNDVVSFLPGALDGGATAATFASATATPSGGGSLPASTGLAVLDREGMAVSCVFTMNNLFGTGRIAEGTGVLLAAAPGVGRIVPPVFAAGMVHNPSLRAFRATTAGSGQEMAAAAAALPLAAMLRGQDATTALRSVPDPGRGVAIGCARYLPGAADSCSAAADPRGMGLAVGAN